MLGGCGARHLKVSGTTRVTRRKLRDGRACCLHIADFPRYFYDSGALVSGRPDDDESRISTVPLALAALVGLLDGRARRSRARPPSRRQARRAKSDDGADQASGLPPAPAPGGGQPTLLGQFGDWGAYTANSARQEDLLRARQADLVGNQPANRPRDPAYIFVSTRPSENVRNEISIVDRLSVQARLGGDRRDRLDQVRDVHAGRRRLDQERRRRGAHGRTHAARAPTWW